ncbi:MAG: branched-chain amino acid transaminase [Anaerolineae bacterium]|nr:branched-chain amino acid transaminase [Anaerolineae bacterium]
MHVSAQQSPKYAYFEGKIVPFEQATVSIMNQTFNYGTGIFGGLRGFWNEDEQQLFVFRPLDHFARFLGTARILTFDFEYTPESLRDILLELLRTEGWQTNIYIRPLAYITTNAIGVKLHGLEYSVCMFSIPFGTYLPSEEGAHVTISSWRRVDDNSIPARGKITGAYANSALIKTDAANAGFDDALVLNQDGHISEASAANFFMVRNGIVYTPPISSNILEGITRRTVIHLLQEEMGLSVVERSIDRTEVYLADEACFTGTGVQISAITTVDHRPVGTGEMGPIVAELRDLYHRVVTGRLEKYRHWLTPVL